MVASSMKNLTDTELKYIEQLLLKELNTESDRQKTWQTKNNYDKPFGKQNMILNCLRAIRGQKHLMNTLTAKW